MFAFSFLYLQYVSVGCVFSFSYVFVLHTNVYVPYVIRCNDITIIMLMVLMLMLMYVCGRTYFFRKLENIEEEEEEEKNTSR